ncbi:hypothetical protein MRB53_038238 [Persea americana]|nr:hypothetical protein MRB53_038238 [Persea americana]
MAFFVNDVFANLSSNRNLNEDEALDFEETYDGLGDNLEEDDDDLNAATFGEAALAGLKPGPGASNFDFSGPSNQPRNGQQRGQEQPAARAAPRAVSPPKAVAHPVRTGYEKYKQADPLPNLGVPLRVSPSPFPVRSAPAPQAEPSSRARKMMSLEEVEESMRARKAATPTASSVPTASSMAPSHLQPMPPTFSDQHSAQHVGTGAQALEPFPFGGVHVQPRYAQNQGFPPQGPPRDDIHHYNQPPYEPPGPMQFSAQQSQLPGHGRLQGPPHGSMQNGQLPGQLLNLSDAERAAYLEGEANRAKRHHKMMLLTRFDGLMTPQDKNFITRIQLQSLLTATGGLEEQGPEAALAEDFYYQVYLQIRGPPRQYPHQPLNHFAQTYLHQTAGRAANRRYPRGGDNLVRRMEQQVQRAVEAARLKPKNKQLIVEGSLGKISFSNAKTPKPLLNIKRTDGEIRPSGSKAKAGNVLADRRTVLSDLETIYGTLMAMEDLERQAPPPPREGGSADEIESHMRWRARIQECSEALWSQLKVLEPIMPKYVIVASRKLSADLCSSQTRHPFISILAHAKGKKLIPRVFRQLDEQQRLTTLTMIVVHLDVLDVTRSAYLHAGEVSLPKDLNDSIELFDLAVMPSLFMFVDDSALGLIIGLLSLIVDRVNVPAIVRTKIGVKFLTIFISRAEVIKSAGHTSEDEWSQWTETYDRLFDNVEPQLPFLFPNPINAGEDVHVWQFLASMGSAANPEQQQRLVIGVKDRVMDTVSAAKNLPEEISRSRLADVNLFMKAIGLDVDLLG